MTRSRKYRKAFKIACELLNGGRIYGIDADLLFKKMLGDDWVVASSSYEDFVLNNLDRFSDNDEVRNKAIQRLGW